MSPWPRVSWSPPALHPLVAHALVLISFTAFMTLFFVVVLHFFFFFLELEIKNITYLEQLAFQVFPVQETRFEVPDSSWQEQVIRHLFPLMGPL